jgi:tetratricopeptide (TPR) repeat protein
MKAIDYSPGSQGAKASALYQRAIPFDKERELEETIRELRSLGSIGEGYATIIEAKILIRRGDLCGATKLYAKAIRKVPGQLHFLRDYCALRYKLGDLKGALEGAGRLFKVARHQDNITYIEEGAFWICFTRSKLGLPVDSKILRSIDE